MGPAIVADVTLLSQGIIAVRWQGRTLDCRVQEVRRALLSDYKVDVSCGTGEYMMPTEKVTGLPPQNKRVITLDSRNSSDVTSKSKAYSPLQVETNTSNIQPSQQNFGIHFGFTSLPCAMLLKPTEKKAISSRSGIMPVSGPCIDS